jgi:hypothetical protein
LSRATEEEAARWVSVHWKQGRLVELRQVMFLEAQTSEPPFLQVWEEQPGNEEEEEPVTHWMQGSAVVGRQAMR